MARKRTHDESALPPERVADIEPVVARHIAAVLKNCGIEPGSALDGTGLRVEDLQNHEFRMSYGQTSHLIRRAIRLLDDQHLGLRLGARVNMVSWGTAYVGLLACADSHEMLEFVAEFLPSGVGLLQLRCEYLPRGPSIVANARFDDPAVEAFLIEKAFAAIALCCRALFGASFGPTHVALTTARPTTRESHEQTFGCPVQFAQSESRMHFPANPVANTSADAVILSRVRKELADRKQSMVRSHELEASIVQALNGRFDTPPTLGEIAVTMHGSERTLRRRLSVLGLGYAELLDRERKRRALALIRSGQRTLSQVASDTGFADVRSLRRAVRRWTGHSSSALRKQAE